MLTVFQTNIRELSLLQTSWSSELNPLLGNEITNGIILPPQSLISGTNVINHRLGRPIVGYLVIRKDADVSIYDSNTSQPNLTFNLISSGPTVVSLYVF